jgi:hypothetical protein
MASGEGTNTRAVIVAVIGLLTALVGVLTSPIWGPGICHGVGLCGDNAAAPGAGSVTIPTTPATSPSSSPSKGSTTAQSVGPTMIWTDPDNATMHWATISTAKWSATHTFTDRHSNSGAAVARNGSMVYMAWREPDDNHIFWSAYNGSAWTAPARLDDRRTEVAPSLGVSHGKLVMAWKDVGATPDAVAMWWSTFDGHAWSAQQAFTDRHSPVSPALGSAGGTLYMAWQEANDGDTYWSDLSDSGWSSPQSLPDHRTTTGPALGNDGNTLVMAWKGVGDDTTIWWSKFDGTSWTAQTDFKPINVSTSPPNNLTSSAPRISGSESTAIMVWRDPDGNIDWSSFHNGRWGNAHTYPATTPIAPAMA